MKSMVIGKADQTVLILGNLNVGKTTIFNFLSRKTARVSNYAGTSVEIGRGRFREGGKIVELIDTPGINTINPESEDEILSRDLMLFERPQAVALVGDGKNLRRTLLLSLQVSEYQIPCVLNINMMDEAIQRGIKINRSLLSSLLGIDVTSTVATEGEGVPAFCRSLFNAQVPKSVVRYHEEIEKSIEEIRQVLAGSLSFMKNGIEKSFRAVGTLLLSGDKGIRKYVQEKLGRVILDQVNSIAEMTQRKFTRPLSVVISETRLKIANEIFGEVQSVDASPVAPWADRLGEWARRPLTGIPIDLIILLAMYLFVGWFGAQFLVGLVEGKLFGNLIIPFCERLVSGFPVFIQNALVGKFGVISVGLTLALG
ncbi:MAG: ferrous iron transporter B, partial [Planctomycetes bacterium]|nr:ferrous iron transporter B [Planctomycetota bacterium]